MPPALPAAKDSTSTPNTSRRCRTPLMPPLSANTKVPKRSSTRTSVSIVLPSQVDREARGAREGTPDYGPAGARLLFSVSSCSRPLAPSAGWR